MQGLLSPVPHGATKAGNLKQVKEAKGSGEEIPVSVCMYARGDAAAARRGCVEDLMVLY